MRAPEGIKFHYRALGSWDDINRGQRSASSYGGFFFSFNQNCLNFLPIVPKNKRIQIESVYEESVVNLAISIHIQN